MLYIAVYGLLWFGIIIIILANGVEQENERERMSMLIAKADELSICKKNTYTRTVPFVNPQSHHRSNRSKRFLFNDFFFFFFFAFAQENTVWLSNTVFCHSTIALSMSVTKNQNHRENRSSILIWNDVDHSLWM